MFKLTFARHWRLTSGLIAAVLFSIAAIGWMHTPSGRVVLAKLGVPCPVNHVDPQVVLAVREHAVAQQRGSSFTAQRPALIFTLNKSTESDVESKTAQSMGHCDQIVRGFHFLRCRGIAAQQLGAGGLPISEIWFSFGPDGTLIAINLYRRDMNRMQALQSWQTALLNLRRTLGAPTRTSGDLTLASLFDKPIAVARVNYVYANYLATVTASHLPYGGLAVREQYMATDTKQ